MQCLIVAAGQGTRLGELDPPKPLVPLRGTPLIGHVIDRARAAGIDAFVVVSGHRGDELRSYLDSKARCDGWSLRHVVNDEWRRANGVSVLKAETAIDEPFVLTMCDHVVDPAITRALIGQARPDGVVLAVDRNIETPLNDPLDATRVRSRDGRIERIGKLLDDYDCYDTGVFLCTNAMFAALRRSQADGDDSISGAMNVLAREGRAHVLDIGAHNWMDIDDPSDLAKAENLLDAGRL